MAAEVAHEHRYRVPFADTDAIGYAFYLMERKRGTIIRKEFPEGSDTSRESLTRLMESVVDTLVELHAIDIVETKIAEMGKPDGYLLRQVEGWAKRWAGSKTEELPEMEELIAGLRERLPESPSRRFWTGR